ncbi:hypothetical protein C8R48DRAFT_774397 [Suillus tomentosus]|nr:hypothetical protein C8R48DRAFT_774397 [Suillus tomentosus]
MQTSHSNTNSSAGSHILQNIQGNVQVSNQHDVEDKVTIMQLPTEILAQIFLYCIPEDEDRTTAPHLDSMLLTAVCRRWREIAVDMSSLWRKLRLEVGRGNWQHRAFCYDTYLKRSRGCQLSLTLECHNDDGKELRNLLQPYVNQISSLSCGLSSGASSCPVVAADFSGLEKLVMYTTRSDSALTIAHSVAHSIAQLPPSMRSLKLTDLWLDLKMLSDFNPLAWVNLTNLEIVVDALDCFPCLLRLCPNLSSLTVIGMFSSVIETSEELPHSKLQSLRISGDLLLDWTGNLGLFDIITLPNLRTIEARDVGPWPHEAFKGFLARSQCPLESLIFGGGVMTTLQQLEEYRTNFPSLSLLTDPMRCSFYF